MAECSCWWSLAAPAGKHTRREFSNRLEPTILISSDQGRTWSKPLRAAPEDQLGGFTEEFDVAELDNGDLLTIYRRIDDAKRWQGILKQADGTWIPGKVGPIALPHSGQPELLKTLQGPVLHIATSGIHWTSDAGQTWNKLNVRARPIILARCRRRMAGSLSSGTWAATTPTARSISRS